MAGAAGDPKIAPANSLNNKANYTCCKTKQCSTIICVNCGAAYHKSCSERVKFTSIDETRVKCCEVKNTNDDESFQLTATKRENVLLQSLYWQSEEKNAILRENNALLVEKIADLTYKLNVLYQEQQNGGPVSEKRKPLYSQKTKQKSADPSTNILSDTTSRQDIPTPTPNQQQLNLPEIEMHKPQQNSTKPKKPETEHPISGTQGDTENFHEVRNRRKKRVSPKILGTNEAQGEDEGFSGVEKKLWLYLYRCKRHVTPEKIRAYINNKQHFENVEITIHELPTNAEKNKCFRVVAPFSKKEDMYNPNFWPRGVGVKRYDFRKQQSYNGEDF